MREIDYAYQNSEKKTGRELDRFMEKSSIKKLWVPVQFYFKSGHDPDGITGKLIQSRF